jgi:hypothetical protein
MGRGKFWTEEENKLLLKMFEEGKSLEEIYDSGSFPERTVDAIRMQIQRLGLNSFVQTIRGSFVQQIEPAKDAMCMEEVVKLFSTAFKHICTLQEVDKFVLERYRIIFQAAKDYGPLLAGYEKWEKIEGQIEELAAAVAELQAAKGAKKA